MTKKRSKRKKRAASGRHAGAALPAPAVYSEAEDLRLARETEVAAAETAPPGPERADQGRVAVFDCLSGIAGDMTIGALVAAGAPREGIAAGLKGLDLPAFELSTENVTRGGIEALHLRVKIAEERTYQPDEMRAIIRSAGLAERVECRALAVIEALEAGEKKAHGTNTPHFHEAGGVDAIIDIVGSMLALELLGIEECFCPVVTVGAGTIAKTEHGAIPAGPGPAAAHILQDAGFPMRFVEASHELVTPTGAAILAAVAKPGPATIVASAHGAGAGTFNSPGRPNVLRVFVGAACAGDPALRTVVELAANIDDMSAALLANARDRLMDEGALDAWLEPIGMKKGRAATKLCALVAEADQERFADLFLRETTTLGVRTTRHERYEARRWAGTFASSLGEVRVKWREWAGEFRGAPEFEDVKALAARLGRPALEVQRTIEREIETRDERRETRDERRETGESAGSGDGSGATGVESGVHSRSRKGQQSTWESSTGK